MKHLKRFDESNTYDFIKGTYTTNNDGSIDVTGDVDLSYRDLSKLPVVFGKVSGYFTISNNKLTTLEGCPVEVGGDFYCHTNNLTSLEGCPETVYDNFNCSKNNLSSLNGCPKIVNGDLDCHNNKIMDFYGFDCIYSSLYIVGNPIDEIFNLCRYYEFIKYLNEFRPIRGNTVLGKRLEECLYMCDIDIDVTKLKFKNYTLLE